MTPRDKISSLKDFEHFLRARGFSRKEALVICTVGFKALYLSNSQRAHNRGDDKSRSN